MNKIVSKLYIALLATLVTLLSACTPETYELGSQDIGEEPYPGLNCI